MAWRPSCAGSAPTRCPSTATWATPEAPARAVAAAVERFGGLDGLVSNAGHQPARAARRLRRRGLGPALRREHPRDLAPRQGGASRAPGVARRHRGRRAPCRAPTPTPASAPTAPARPPSSCSPGARAGARPRRDPRQHRLAGHDAHGHDRARLRRPGRRRRARDALVPLGRVAQPDDIAAASRSCSGPTRATSTATTSSSTAASPATTSAACRGSRRSPGAERLHPR